MDQGTRPRWLELWRRSVESVNKNMLMHRLFFVLALAFTTQAQEIRYTPLTLKDGGTPEKPAVFDGKVEQSNNKWRKP